MGVLRAALFGVFVAALLIVPAHGAPNEYQVKAIFLLNFSRFVEWPPPGDSGEAAFVIGVLGDDPFGAELDQVMQGESVQGRPIVVRRVATPQQASACQILFIHRPGSRSLSDVLAAIDRPGVLTVSDDDKAAQRGVMIGLVTRNNHVRLQVNVEQARAAGLTISSNLLRSAQIVTGGREAS